MDYVGLIPAKGRSCGLPGKNVIDLCGKPLISWTIEASINAGLLSSVFVSTESEAIANISQQYNIQLVDRPLELCGDLTTSDEVIKHAIPIIRSRLKKQDFGIVLLQATSPLRTAIDIDEAVTGFSSSSADALVSVFEINNSILKTYKIDHDGFLLGAFSPDAPYTPRQRLPKTYMPNGAIYIFSAKKFEESEGIPRKKVLPYVMAKSRSIDIDSKEDLELAAKYLGAKCPKHQKL